MPRLCAMRGAIQGVVRFQQKATQWPPLSQSVRITTMSCRFRKSGDSYRSDLSSVPAAAYIEAGVRTVVREKSLLLRSEKELLILSSRARPCCSLRHYWSPSPSQSKSTRRGRCCSFNIDTAFGIGFSGFINSVPCGTMHAISAA